MKKIFCKWFVENYYYNEINKKRRLKWKNIIAFFLMIVCLLISIIAIINIIKWKIYSYKTNKQIDEIENMVIVEEVDDNDKIVLHAKLIKKEKKQY